MSIYKQILSKSKDIDWSKVHLNKKFKFTFPVSKNHYRYKKIKKYVVECSKFSNFEFDTEDLIFVDKNVYEKLPKDLQEKLSKFKHLELVISSEETTKTLNYAERFLIKYFEIKITRVVAVGGGVLLDFGSYLARKNES